MCAVLVDSAGPPAHRSSALHTRFFQTTLERLWLLLVQFRDLSQANLSCSFFLYERLGIHMVPCPRNSIRLSSAVESALTRVPLSFPIRPLPAKNVCSSAVCLCGSRCAAHPRVCSTLGRRALQTIPAQRVFHFRYGPACQKYTAAKYRFLHFRQSS